MLRRSRGFFLAKPRPSLLLCTLLFACDEAAIRGLEPMLTLEAKTIDFGEVEVQDELTKTLVFKNEGRRALTLSDANFTGQDAFSYPELPKTIAAGAEFSLAVTFKPAHLGDLAAQLDLASNDKGNARLTISFTGSGIASTASQVDFAKVIAKLSKTRTITPPPAFKTSDLTTTSAPTCATMQAFLLDGSNVVFAPECAGTFATTVRYRNEEGVIARAFLTGEAVEDCTRLDETHKQRDPNDNRVDVLFVIDDSDSTADDQLAINTSANAFFNALVSGGADFHVGVTTTDYKKKHGTLVAAPGGERVVTPASGVDLFRQILAQIDTKGNTAEYGFATIATALTDPAGMFSDGSFAFGPGAADSTFLRTDAGFYAIIVSDADDSTGHEADVAHYIATMAGMPPGFKAKVVSAPDENFGIYAIVDPGIDAATCGGTSDNHGTPIYHSAIAALGSSGQLISLCSDVDITLTALGSAIAKPLCTFPLKKPPESDEPYEMCIVGGSCFASTDIMFSANVATIAPAVCPMNGATLRMKYATCLRSQDADHDGIPDVMDDTP
jgi:hypothetical protein